MRTVAGGPNPVVFQVGTTRELDRRIRARCALEDCSVASLIRRAVEAYLEERLG